MLVLQHQYVSAEQGSYILPAGFSLTTQHSMYNTVPMVIAIKYNGRAIITGNSGLKTELRVWDAKRALMLIHIFKK